MHLTLVILRTSQTVSHALAFFWLDGFAVPAPAQVTQAVGGQSQNQMQNRLWFANKFSGSRLLFNSISFIGKVFVWLHRVAKISIKVFGLWFRSTLVFLRDWFCRLSKSACLFAAKFQVSWVCKIILASLVVVVLWQSQVFQNCRSGQFVFLFGKFRFYRKRFHLLSLLVIRRFFKFCF